MIAGSKDAGSCAELSAHWGDYCCWASFLGHSGDFNPCGSSCSVNSIDVVAAETAISWRPSKAVPVKPSAGAVRGPAVAEYVIKYRGQRLDLQSAGHLGALLAFERFFDKADKTPDSMFVYKTSSRETSRIYSCSPTHREEPRPKKPQGLSIGVVPLAPQQQGADHHSYSYRPSYADELRAKKPPAEFARPTIESAECSIRFPVTVKVEAY